MRIAEVAEFYAPSGGGVRSYIDRKFEAAAEAGHELFVLAPGSCDEVEARPGGAVVWIRSPALPMDANYRMFWHAAPVHAALDRLRPDLVEASSPWRGAWIVAAWRGVAARTMFFHADPVASYPHRWLAPLISPERIDRICAGFWAYLRRLTAAFESIVVGGAWLANRLERQGLKGIVPLPLGVDSRLFSPALRDEALRAELLEACALPPSARLLLGVGRFHPEKRWPMIIEAVEAARPAGQLGLVLIGDGLDRARVLRAAEAARHVHLLPPIRDRSRLAAILASGDALVHGCESETFGLVAAEAAASGLPLIVPDRGGCAHLADCRTSETYLAGDGQAATRAIERLFAREPEGLRAAARDLAATARSDSRHFSDLFAHYESLLERGRQLSRAREPVAAP